MSNKKRIKKTKEIAKILKKNRIEQNISQKALSEWTKINERTLREYENPLSNKNILYKNIIKLIRELDLNVDEQRVCLEKVLF